MEWGKKWGRAGEKGNFCGVVVVCFGFRRTAVDRNKINAGLGDSSGLYLWSFPWRQRLFVHNHDAAEIFGGKWGEVGGQ